LKECQAAISYQKTYAANNNLYPSVMIAVLWHNRVLGLFSNAIGNLRSYQHAIISDKLLCYVCGRCKHQYSQTRQRL
jgi:hypothetical protein